MQRAQRVGTSASFDTMTTKAFRVTVKDWPEATSIHGATSRAEAKFSSWKSAKNAGYDHVTFAKLRATRAPEFDCVAETIAKRGHGVDETSAHLAVQQLRLDESKALR